MQYCVGFCVTNSRNTILQQWLGDENPKAPLSTPFPSSNSMNLALPSCRTLNPNSSVVCSLRAQCDGMPGEEALFHVCNSRLLSRHSPFRDTFLIAHALVPSIACQSQTGVRFRRLLGLRNRGKDLSGVWVLSHASHKLYI